MFGQLNQILLYLAFSIHQVIYLWGLNSKKKKFCTSIPPRRAILNIVDISQNEIFQNCNFFPFFAYSLRQQDERYHLVRIHPLSQN